MSLGGHYSKTIFRDKKGREIKTECDFLSKRLRHDDGSFGTYRNGKLVAKEDAPSPESKFYKPTPVSTVLAEPAEKDKMNCVKKRIDVNAPSMRL